MAFTDDFTGTDGDLLESRTGWTKEVDGLYKLDVYSNGLASRSDGSGSGRSLYVCTDQASNSHYSQCKFPAANSSTELVAWAVDQDNYLCLYFSGTGSIGAKMAQRVAGTRSTLLQVSGASGASQAWKIEVDASAQEAEFFLDDVSQGAASDVSALTQDSSQGLVAGAAVGNTKLIDDFEADALGAAGISIPVVQHHRQQQGAH